MDSTLNVICLQTTAFYSLIDEVVERINERFNLPEKKWIFAEEAMELLGISSKTTLQKLRDEGKIRFSHPEPKLIFYDRESILYYIEQHAKDTF